MWLWLISSIAASILGGAVGSWFADTRLGEWFYRTVDNIWYLAGDKSTDYNFYTKRFILACVYYSTLIYWLKITDNNLEKTKKFIEKSIKNTSIIPKLKTSFLKVFTNH